MRTDSEPFRLSPLKRNFAERRSMATFLEEVLCQIAAERLANGEPVHRFMVEVRGSHMIGVDCNLIERIYEHAMSSDVLDEIRSAWMSHAKRRGMDPVEATEDFTMTLAAFLASLMHDGRLTGVYDAAPAAYTAESPAAIEKSVPESCRGNEMR